MGIENPKLGFGQAKAKRLFEEISLFLSHTDVQKTSYAYNESMSVLKRYIQFTIDSGVSALELEKRYQELSNRYGFDMQEAGSRVMEMADVYRRVDSESSLHFLCSRHSIRSYEIRPVEKEVMDRVLSIAATSPSACNRQPCKVFWTNDDACTKRISKLIPGNKGFEDAIPNWAIIAVDRVMFGEQECLQWYLNGGIYASYLVLAMHALHLGSCIFQIPISWEGIPGIREIAGIPDHYAIACAVGFGYPKDRVKCLCAARKPVSEYSIQF